VSALDAALGYARQAWPVFPCRPWPSKAPLTAHGFRDASTEEAVIRGWWRRWPDAIIGAPTGSSFVVLDVDPRHGGIETLAGLGFTAMPATPTAKTGGNGFHLYFAPPDPPIRNTSGDRGRGIGKGLDWRGRGGFVIVPAPGTGYEWVAETIALPFAAVPPELLPRRNVGDDRIGTAHRCDTLTEYGEAALRSACANILAAPKGEQQATLNGEAYSIGRLAGCGDAPMKLALDVLVVAARGIASYDRSRPWRPGEAEAMVRRAFADGLARPRLSLDDKQRALDAAIAEYAANAVDVDWTPTDE
jgi:hypothetical protein